MVRGEWVIAALMLAGFPAPGRAGTQQVRSDNGRFWIECRNAPLQDVLREIGGIAPMELWLDGGIEDKEVSVSLAGVSMKEAVVKLFEDAKVNYVLYLDPSNRERVAKIYVGAGSGGAARLPRDPTVSPEFPAARQTGSGAAIPGLDPDALVDSPEAQEVLGALRTFLEQQQQNAADPEDPGAGEPGSAAAVPPALRELLNKVSQFPRGPFTPGTDASPASPSSQKDQKEKPRPQL